MASAPSDADDDLGLFGVSNSTATTGINTTRASFSSIIGIGTTSIHSNTNSNTTNSNTDDERRSRIGLLGQQRNDFNISPPTIPRSDTANIFSGGLFTNINSNRNINTDINANTDFTNAAFFQQSAPLHSQSYSHSHWHTQMQGQEQAQGLIPPYQQQQQDSHHHQQQQHQQQPPEPSNNLRWQSRMIPQAQHDTFTSNRDRDRRFFTPLHFANTNTNTEESKLPSSFHPISPVGVTSPGFQQQQIITSPPIGLIHETQTLPSTSAASSSTPIAAPISSPIPMMCYPINSSTPTQQYSYRPPSAMTIGTSASMEIGEDSVDSEGRVRQQRKNRKSAQRRLRTPGGSGGGSNTGAASMSGNTSGSNTGFSFLTGRNEHESGAKSPPPQNLRGDPFRSAKVKTELCRHYNTKKGCPFGDKCNYAHGGHELKYTKLMDLERAGLVDVEIFRTHPCPTWVATGACPFDQRCIGLHDSRVEGDPTSTACWLPHAETLINKINKGCNVDKFYHERVASIYNSCPIYGFVPKQSRNSIEMESTWNRFYDFICCHNRTKAKTISFDVNRGHVIQPHELEEEHILEIVLKMRQRKLSQSYAYIPTHLLSGDLCMILQERTFQLNSVLNEERQVMTFTLGEIEGIGMDQPPPPSQNQTQSTSIESSSSMGSNINTGSSSKVFKAYEIVFGPVGDPTVRQPSTWFDIPKSDLMKCTAQQAKHHKRSRHRIKKVQFRTTHSAKASSSSASSSSSNHLLNPNQNNANNPTSPRLQVDDNDAYLDESYKAVTIAPFYNHQPRDHETFDLITGILLHRLKKVKFLSGKFDPSIQHQVGSLLESERMDLKTKYFNLYRFWILSSWPDQILQEPIQDETDVPPVNGDYVCVVDSVKFTRADECYGLGQRRCSYDMLPNSKILPSLLWKSFTVNMLLMMGKNIGNIRRVTSTRYDGYFRQIRRLPILRQMSMGVTVDTNRFLPHIRPLQGIGPYSLSQCIEDLLGDWEELKAHYDENNQSSPLRRTDLNVNVNVSMNLDQNQTPKPSLKHEGMDRETSEYLDKGTKLLTRMSF